MTELDFLKAQLLDFQRQISRNSLLTLAVRLSLEDSLHNCLEELQRAHVDIDLLRRKIISLSFELEDHQARERLLLGDADEGTSEDDIEEESIPVMPIRSHGSTLSIDSSDTFKSCEDSSC